MPLLSDNDFSRIGRVVTAFERGFGRAAQLPDATLPAASSSVVALLLEDLPGDAEALACVCRYERSNSVQSVSLYGGFVDSIKLGVKFAETDTPLYTDPIKIVGDGSAKSLYKALTGIRGITPGDVVVEFGTFGYNRKTYDTGRWFVTWQGKYAGKQLPLMLAQVKYQDTDGYVGPGITYPVTIAYTRLVPLFEPITVLSALPLPTPTPLRAGAKVIATQIAGIGYVVTAAEARDYFRA